MKDISDLLDIIEKDEARKLFSDTFYPNHDFNLMDMIKNFDKDFEKFWSENFNTDVADRPALVEALKKEVKSRKNAKDLKDLLGIFTQYSTAADEIIGKIGSIISKKEKDKP